VSSSSGAVFFLCAFTLPLFVVLVGVGWLLSRALCGKLEFGVGACDGAVDGAGESCTRSVYVLVPQVRLVGQSGVTIPFESLLNFD
jgi:hypothetical protein